MEGRGGGGCCADERRAGRGNLGGGQETESVAVERGHSTAAAFSGRFSLFCWWGDGLTPEEQGLRAVGVEHATREQEMQELCTTGRSVGGCFFVFFWPRRVIKHQNGTRPKAEMTTWGVLLEIFSPCVQGEFRKVEVR